MFPIKSSLAHCLVSATLICAAHAAWAGVPNATCSSGIAKTAACQGGNKAGQPASKDASCCEVKPSVGTNTAAEKKLPPHASPGLFPDSQEAVTNSRGAPYGFSSVKLKTIPPPNTSDSATKPPPGSQTGPMDPTDGDKAAGKVAPISDVDNSPPKKKKPQ